MLARLGLRIAHRRSQRFLTTLTRTAMSANATQDNAEEIVSGEASLTKSAGTIGVDRLNSYKLEFIYSEEGGETAREGAEVGGQNRKEYGRHCSWRREEGEGQEGQES